MSKKYGHIKISRKAFDATDGDPFWLKKRVFSEWEAWEYLLQLSQWKSHKLATKYGIITLERGQFVASVRKLAKDWRWSTKRVFIFLKLIEKEARIMKQITKHAGTVYLVVKYDTYQGHDHIEETDLETDLETDRKQTGNKNKQLSSKAVTDMSHEKPCDGYPPDFELTWKAYPKRSGTASKRDTYKQFRARLKAGVEYDVLHAGVLRYAEYCLAKGSIGTELVMMPERFFGAGEHYLNDYAPPSTTTELPTPLQTRAALLYRLYLDHGFCRVQSIDVCKQRIKELAEQGKIVEPRRFWYELKVVKPWSWLGTAKSHDQRFSITKIATAIAEIGPVLERTTNTSVGAA